MGTKFCSKMFVLLSFALASVVVMAQESQPNMNKPQEQTPPPIVTPPENPATGQMHGQEKEKPRHKKKTSKKHKAKNATKQEAKNEPSQNDKTPFIAEVTATKLMYHAEPSSDTKSTVMGILHKGAVIAGLKSENGFIKIPPPEGAWCWLHSTDAKKEGNMAIAKKGAKLKADSRLSSATLGTAKDGERMKIIKEHSGWYKVAAPTQARYWISRKYLNILEKASSEEEAIANASKGAATIGKVVTEKFNQAQAEYANAEKMVDANRIEDADYSKAIELYQFVAGRATDKKIRDEAQTKLALAQKKQDMLNNVKQGISSAEQAAKQVFQEPQSQFVYQGWLDGTGGLWINRPGTHKLMSGGKVVCYLKPAEGDENMLQTLKNYWGQYVGVNGEVQDSQWGKVVIVKQVQPLLQQ